jgi:rubrerythrin
MAETYTITQDQLTQISEALLDAESLMEIDGLVEDSRLAAMTKAREEVDSILYMNCELCGDLRLEEDLNEDQRCPPCEEREEKNENGI